MRDREKLGLGPVSNQIRLEGLKRWIKLFYLRKVRTHAEILVTKRRDFLFISNEADQFLTEHRFVLSTKVMIFAMSFNPVQF